MIPRAYIAALPALFLSGNFSSKGSGAIFWPPEVPGTHVIHRHAFKQNIHLRLKKKIAGAEDWGREVRETLPYEHLWSKPVEIVSHAKMYGKVLTLKPHPVVHREQSFSL